MNTELNTTRSTQWALSSGWLGMAVFLTLGIVLESFHALKVGDYLDAGNETRRLLWTLAHSHGTLLSLLNIAYALTAMSVNFKVNTARWIVRWLIIAQWLLPLGFLLGGVSVHGGDPGLPILIVPFAAVSLLFGAALTAYNVVHAHRLRHAPASSNTEKRA